MRIRDLFKRKASPPTDFVTQILEPTGGKMPRPKDWSYTEGHRGPTFMWTLSREDLSAGRPYTTGVRIQLFTGIHKGTGKTAKQFILDIAAAKKSAAAKVHKIFEKQNHGLFSRIGLEVEEGPHRIIYSLLFGDGDLDMAVVLIAGTTKELWQTYAATFDRMGDFELIDMKRFGK